MKAQRLLTFILTAPAKAIRDPEWGVLLRHGDRERTVRREPATTNNRMELRAVIE